MKKLKLILALAATTTSSLAAFANDDVYAVVRTVTTQPTITPVSNNLADVCAEQFVICEQTVSTNPRGVRVPGSRQIRQKQCFINYQEKQRIFSRTYNVVDVYYKYDGTLVPDVSQVIIQGSEVENSRDGVVQKRVASGIRDFSHPKIDMHREVLNQCYSMLGWGAFYTPPTTRRVVTPPGRGTIRSPKPNRGRGRSTKRVVVD